MRTITDAISAIGRTAERHVSPPNLNTTVRVESSFVVPSSTGNEAVRRANASKSATNQALHHQIVLADTSLTTNSSEWVWHEDSTFTFRNCTRKVSICYIVTRSTKLRFFVPPVFRFQSFAMR